MSINFNHQGAGVTHWKATGAGTTYVRTNNGMLQVSTDDTTYYDISIQGAALGANHIVTTDASSRLTSTATPSVTGLTIGATGLTQNGGVVSGSGAYNWALGSSSGTFATPSGNFTFNGNIVSNITQTGATTFTTGTGTVTLNGAVSIAGNRNMTAVAGTGAFDWSLGTGLFKTTTGAVTIGGNSTVDINNATTAGNITIGNTSATQTITLNNNTTIGAGKTLTLAQDPSTGMQAATKQYVDNISTGLNPTTSCACATTANITLSGEQTIDGVLTSASRVLVKNQTTASQNGIYVSAAGAWARATDADTIQELAGIYTLVTGGTTNINAGYVCTNSGSDILGTTNITFVNFSTASAPAYTWDDGLVNSGTSINIDYDNITINSTAPGAAGKIQIKDVSGLSAQGTTVIPKFQWNTKGQITVGALATASDINALYANTAFDTGAFNSVFGAGAIGRSNYTISYGGAGNMGVAGDAEAGNAILYFKTTTSQTSLRLSTDGATAVAGNQIVLNNNSTIFFRIHFTVRATASTDSFGAVIEGVAERGASAAATTVLLTTQTIYTKDTATTMDCSVTADTTLGALNITVSNPAALATVKALAHVQILETNG